MSIFHDNILLGSSGSGGEYQISRSLRFNSADSAYFNRTPSIAGNTTTWTWSGWVKRNTLGTNQQIFSAWNSDANQTALRFTGDNLAFYVYTSSSFLANYVTTQVFRDPSAWYHIVAVLDTTNSTSTDRVRLYVNGSRITTFSTSTAPNQNTVGWVNTTNTHVIGRFANTTSTEYLSAYLADIYFIDGQALTPTSFGSFDSNNIWQPLQYTGTFGTNGFYLPFSDNAAATAFNLGKDTRNVVGTATGGLPILNTDFTGVTATGGVASDSNASNIVLAIPMNGTNNGTTFTDQSATIKGSGVAKTITPSGNTKTVTNISQFYGSSAYFDGTGDYLYIPTSTDFQFETGNFTIECWAYPVSFGNGFALYVHWDGGGASPRFGLLLQSTGISVDTTYGMALTFNGTTTINLNNWYHCAIVRNGSTFTTYINGNSISTATSSVTYTPTGYPISIGDYVNDYSTGYGYIQDLRVYKGLAKYTSNFTPPLRNDWTPNNFSITAGSGNDSLVDTPTNYGTDTGAGGEVRGNYCTFNPLDNGGITLANGNLDASRTVASWLACRGTIGMSSGKYYWEFTVTSTVNASNGPMVGIAKSLASLANYIGADANGWSYHSIDGKKYTAAAGTAYGATYGINDIIGVAFDADNGTLTFYKNGTSQGTAFTGLTSGPYFPTISLYGTANGSLNTGQRPFAYTAPSGYETLCTQNLTTPTILSGKNAVDVVTYTGTGPNILSTASSLSFNPDLIWIKDRTNSNNHQLLDSIRSTISVSTGALPIYNVTDTYGFTKGSGTATDPNASSLLLAVAMDGTNGSSTFTDLSSTISGTGSPFTLTNSGTPTITTSFFKYYGSSGSFTSSSRIQVSSPTTALLSWWTTNYTAECWVYPTAVSQNFFGNQNYSSLNYWNVSTDANGKLNFYYWNGSVGTNVTTTGTLNLNAWNHIAFVYKTGTGILLFINGVLSGSAASLNGTPVVSTSTQFGISGASTTSYMQDMRVYSGVAKYSSNFIPPQAILQSNTTAIESSYTTPSGGSVAWCWDAGTSTVTNNAGSITSQVRANASAGISIVGFTKTANTNETFGHGLGVSPSLVIVKERGNNANWWVWHVSLSGGTYALNLNGTAAQTNYPTIFTTSPSSTIVSLGTGWGLTNNLIAYCFAPVAGFSAFGSYTGNGSADGPFVYTGFSPKWILLKVSSTTGNWTIIDDVRLGYNVDNNPLYPNLTNAESTTDIVDIVSNGFKVRTTDASVNTNAATYIYAAFAENPFTISRAR